MAAYAAWSVVVFETRRRGEIALHGCGDSIAAIGKAMMMYVEDNSGAFPPADGWCDRLVPYLPDVSDLSCPSARNRQWSYAFSAALGGVKADAIADPLHVVVLYESDQGWNAAGGPELLPEEPRHLHDLDYYVLAAWLQVVRSRDRIRDARGRWVWAKAPMDDSVRWEPALNGQPKDPQ